jgi:hypothetical protein
MQTLRGGPVPSGFPIPNSGRINTEFLGELPLGQTENFLVDGDISRNYCTGGSWKTCIVSLSKTANRVPSGDIVAPPRLLRSLAPLPLGYRIL